MKEVDVNILKDGPILINGKTNVTRDGENIEVSEQYALAIFISIRTNPKFNIWVKFI